MPEHMLELKLLLLATPALFVVAGTSALYAAMQDGGVVIKDDALIPLGLAVIVLCAAVAAAWKLSQYAAKWDARLAAVEKELQKQTSKG